MRNLDRFQGCLVAGAAGDALGYAVEFRKIRDIRHDYGPRGITDYRLCKGKARISDDTQMTLFTAAGLLFNETRGNLRGICPGPVHSIWFSYRNWLRTQKEDFPQTEWTAGYTWLMNIPELYSQRAPGRTCLSALSHDHLEWSMESPLNHSKGCGGVIRVAPIGLYYNDKRDIWTADRIGAEAAALTHGHEMGYIPAAMLVHIIYRIAGNGWTIHDAVDDALQDIPRQFSEAEHMDAFLERMRLAVRLADPDVEDLKAIEQLGEGRVADEALAIAVYCALKYPDDLEKCLIAAVNHSGNSDSTGAIAGNIVGASIGYAAIPGKFKANLELLDVILELAADLHHDCTIEEYGPEDPVWEAKYVSGKWKMPR